MNNYQKYFVKRGNSNNFGDVHHVLLTSYNCEKEGNKLNIKMHHNVIELTFNVQYIEGKFHKLINLLSQKRK